MPGIAGIVSRRSPGECQLLVREMVGTMMHQRTLVSGTHFAPALGVYGGWVAHKGSFAARQFAPGGDSQPALLFSGEYFGMSAHGIRPQHNELEGDACNRNALLKCYETEQDVFVANLNGLFSGLLIDPTQHRAILFNDRFGSERIYIYERHDATYFASEAKALLRIVPELRCLDDESVAHFLAYGSVLHNRTLFRNLHLLPGGSLWTFANGTIVSKRSYFVPDTWESQSILPERAYDAEFADRFRSVLPNYFASESRIGISLTGGLDTRMIVACLFDSGIEPICYTFGGLTGNTLDAQIALRIAKNLGLEHLTLRIGADFLANFHAYVDRTVFVTDGCAGALGAHEIYLTNLAAQLAPIRLTGNFGSEILRSVSTFKPLALTNAMLDASYHDVVDRVISAESIRRVHPVTHAAFEEIPWHLSGTLAAGRSQITFRTPYLDNGLVQLSYQASAKIRRSPRSALNFINDSNTTLAKIPTDRGLVWNRSGVLAIAHRLFCQATFKLDYLHKEGLPGWLGPLDPMLDALQGTGLLGLHKFLSYRGWFRRELSEYVRDVVTDAQTARQPYWNGKALPGLVDDHVRGRHNRLRELNAILTLEAVDRLLIREIASAGPQEPSAQATSS